MPDSDKPSAVEVVAAVIQREGQVLIAQRPQNKPLGGLWEFPGGKIEPTETHFEALKRELQEEIGIAIQSASLIERKVNVDVSPKVNLHFYRVKDFSGQDHGKEGQTVKWVYLEQLAHYSFPSANQSIIANLMRTM